MNNLARQLNQEGVRQEVGSVAVAGDKLLVRTDTGQYHVRRAESCWLSPEEGDLVLLALVPQGGAYVLAVLERDKARPAKLRVEGDLHLELPDGRFTVTASKGVDILSEHDLNVVSAKVQVNAVEASVAFDRGSVVGAFLQNHVKRIKTVAGSVDMVVERVSQNIKRCYRTILETDQLRAERVDYKASKNMSLAAKNTLITAEKLVKMDGDQIHLG